MTTCVATFGISLDGFIATEDGGVDWLNAYSDADMGPWFADFMSGIDALLMGRSTYEVVRGFGAWPYEKPVHVLSRTLAALPAELDGKAELARGDPATVRAEMAALGYRTIYVDGGATVRAFLETDLIDRMIISHIPILLGGGIPLFGTLPAPLRLTHEKAEVLFGQLVISHYRRDRPTA